MKIANVSASTAGRIKQIIEKEYVRKNPNKFIPYHCVPTKEVIKYFDLDIEFLKNLAAISIEDGKNE